MTTILAIDPGSTCGWCVSGPGPTFTSGTWDLTARRHEGGGMRFLRLRRYLTEILDKDKPQVVVYEEVRRHRGVDAAHIYGGIVALIAEECEARKIPYTTITVGQVKKLATGMGNADKDDMVEVAQHIWPEAGLEDDNEVDARCIAVACRDALEGGS